MSIRRYNKDHLKDHAGIRPIAPAQTIPPQSEDPLVYWTKHEDDSCEVDLRPFAAGQQVSKHVKGGGKKFKPFSGRPELIRQMAPALQEALLYGTKGTVRGYFAALREWWRIMDAVEAAAAKAGKPMTRVEDVQLLTHVHSQYACNSGMNRHQFGTFRALVDTTLMALGAHKTYWEGPENASSEKRIPAQEQRNSLRFAVKQACRRVMEQWEQSDRLSQTNAEPEDPQEASVWRNVRYFRNAQDKSGKIMPTPNDLADFIPPWARNARGNFELSLWRTVFPSHRDADAVWHQCLLYTGWNPSTLTSLDVTKNFLKDHFKDAPNDSHQRFVLNPQTYELVGTKARAYGKEQTITGQWKSLDAPGHLIKKYLERVEPLRQMLKDQLANEYSKYERMSDASYAERATQFAEIKNLEQGVRSVWLYITRRGTPAWITEQMNMSGFVNGKPTTYLAEIVHSLNIFRSSENSLLSKNGREPLQPIPYVRPRDFRDWFADYVYRASHGNILHVKKALNHSRISTTTTYINNHIINQESSNSARRFLNILLRELDGGRVDLTILAHLYRYGEISSDQEELLAQARALPKSRMNIACKDSFHPPPHLKATLNAQCDVQRCMLCVEHAVLLPESLDGLAMRVEELRTLQGVFPIETWIEEMYDVELKNNLIALQRFDLNRGLAARKKWAQAIALGNHYVPGLPPASSSELMDLV